ncbi:MAG: RnfABCDGE type electron transport complex subunit A [Bacilli bacterium]|jgi:electron transport complex protein RnfA|nr:RnfABCDGE type electron transport complex subunit A [Bacilli bacterium]MCH4210260.1 RnfABCDGE type electron transport complex subunit A [Bacilli bacterium]MCH4228208.1 RnfABCDGE type electron transport complex subunit A [Bacilli bacterium]MCH4277438.1 RnfABCDGE type electron transport complex subunit A [Bacilli bacterium]MCI2054660.1 RnfABCDGE type electron transport complex subunit A [Bacilli bacterium]
MGAYAYFVSFLMAIVSSMLVDNVVLSRFYGICSFIGVGNKAKSAVSMGLAVTFVIILASLVCWPIYNYILVPAGLTFMDTVVYILVIASLVQVVGLFIKKYSPALYKSLGIYLPLITTNCAVLGVAQSNTDQALDFGMSMANAIGTSLGFLLVIFVFSCIRTRLEAYPVPRAFKGVPIALITAAIMAMAFMGLSGIGA